METLELILGLGGVAAIFALCVSLPATYGVFLRQDLDADWKKLPLLLRFFYTVDVKKQRNKKGWLSKHPEMLSLGFVVLLCGSVGWTLFVNIFEVDEQTGELQIDTTGADAGVIAIVSLILWWLIFTFGTELWLKRKWLPKHAIRDKTPSQELVDRNA